MTALLKKVVIGWLTPRLGWFAVLYIELPGNRIDLVVQMLDDNPLVSRANGDHLEQLGVHASEAEVMKAHRRKLTEKKYSKVKESLAKAREHRLADLKVPIYVLSRPRTARCLSLRAQLCLDTLLFEINVTYR